MNIAMIAFLIIGVFNILLGFLIERFELADLITFYNRKKDKDNKLEIEKIAGKSIFLMGIFMIFIVVLSYFTDMNVTYFTISQMSIILGFVIFMILKTVNLRKK